MAAEIVDDRNASTAKPDQNVNTLEAWVMTKVDEWRDHYRANYSEKHDEYYRLFRGIWSPKDRTRDTERSRIIAPAIQTAVESCVAEIEEAAFGRGKWFDMIDDDKDPEKADIAKLREMMHDDFGRLKTKQRIAECILNAAIFGTGIGELVVDTIIESVPATQPIEGTKQQAIGVIDRERHITKLIPVMPRHFLSDPAADGVEIDQSLGCAIDKEVPTFQIEELMESGIYLKKNITTDVTDVDRQADPELTVTPKGQTRLTKYFGKVPRKLLEAAQVVEGEEIVDLGVSRDDDKKSFLVEAIVIIADGGVLLKATENNNMMGDRNIVAFQWDKVPSRFQGRGVVEKGYNSQKALDAEMRARIDALGLTVHPMMGVDASRMPRGARPTIAPGKMILTNGNPQEVLHPFTFGSVDQITFPQVESLDKMVQQATGANDITPGNINSNQASAAFSMARGSIVKRHKRTQLNFEESFLIPFINKVAWRYMQFEPELFPAKDVRFIVKGNLGIIAREYEVGQLVQLLQTLGDDNKIKPEIMKAVVDHMNISNRESVIDAIVAGQTPSEEDVAKAKQAEEDQRAFLNSQTAALNAQANESNQRAAKIEAEKVAIPVKLEIDQIAAVLKADSQDTEFEKLLEIADRRLAEKKLALTALIADKGTNSSTT